MSHAIRPERIRGMRCTLCLATLLFPRILGAQATGHHPPTRVEAHARADSGRAIAKPARSRVVQDHAAIHHPMDALGHAMPALYGPYPMTREVSGTAWQPDAAPHRGRHLALGRWSAMLHGEGMLVWDRQRGPRGDQDLFSSNMVMAVATRPLGAGRLGLRAMLSAEPATVGKQGYPLLLQTGETADGRTPLIDRQHPHDLLMEVAASWAVADATRALFLYAGFPGEPALGPPIFMHRSSGASFPEAPISHHWLDSTHITYGVVTLGGVARDFKLEVSAFRGREPDQDRWGWERPKLDSHSFRASWNPGARWALQASFARLESPEQLEPDTDADRTTASASHAGRVAGRAWHTTFAWGQNRSRPGGRLHALLLASTLEMGGWHTVLGRAERVEKDELFDPPDPRAGQVFTVGKLTAGWEYELPSSSGVRGTIGVAGTLSIVPASLEADYGRNPASAMLFGRVALP